MLYFSTDGCINKSLTYLLGQVTVYRQVGLNHLGIYPTTWSR